MTDSSEAPAIIDWAEAAADGTQTGTSRYTSGTWFVARNSDGSWHFEYDLDDGLGRRRPDDQFPTSDRQMAQWAAQAFLFAYCRP